MGGDRMAVDWNVLGNLCASVGGFALVGKWLIKSVEKTNENLPVMIASIKTLQDNDKELFASRNEHAIEIAEIKTGIEYCEACNSHRHRRETDSKPKTKASR
jgi:hypothetical protein